MILLALDSRQVSGWGFGDTRDAPRAGGAGSPRRRLPGDAADAEGLRGTTESLDLLIGRRSPGEDRRVQRLRSPEWLHGPPGTSADQAGDLPYLVEREEDGEQGGRFFSDEPGRRSPDGRGGPRASSPLSPRSAQNANPTFSLQGNMNPDPPVVPRYARPTAGLNTNPPQMNW